MEERRIGIVLKLAAEFSVIVAGVLVALFAEAWWSERDNRRFEEELISDMAGEFEVNVSILNADMADNDNIIGHIDEIIAMSAEDLAVLTDDEVSTLFEPFGLLFADFDPAMGISRALVQSGDLTAVQSRNLRLALANWSALLEEKTRYSRNAHEMVAQLAGVVAIAQSDGQWSQRERRELQFRVQYMRDLVGLVVENQYKLQMLAVSIVGQLESRK
jgi:hypothetical protein